MHNVLTVDISYGTSLVKPLLPLKHRYTIPTFILIDPIPFLIHQPALSYNFTRRKPRRANEIMLSYFSSMDMMVSHTLARRFFWSERVMWIDDVFGADQGSADGLGGRPKMLVSLAGRDCVIGAGAVWRYLTNTNQRGDVDRDAAYTDVIEGEDEDRSRRRTAPALMTDWKDNEKSLQVLWYDDLDHADVFGVNWARKMLVAAIVEVCSTSSEDATRNDGPPPNSAFYGTFS
jgi:hypothetical protein